MKSLLAFLALCFSLVGALGQDIGFSPPISTPLILPQGGLIGFWNAADFISSPVAAIPNRVASITPVDIVPVPRRNFGITRYYIGSAVTIVDSNAIAPDGSGDATSITTAASANWGINLQPLSLTLATGTYTCGIWVRWKNATGDPNFRFGAGTVTTEAGIGTGTAPDFLWHRYSQTFTVNGSTAKWFIPFQRPASGNTQANFEIVDFDCYNGSSDLLTNDVGSGNIIFGNGLGQGAVTHDAVSVSLLGATGGGLQLSNSFNSFTMLYVAKTSGTPTSAVFNSIVSVMGVSWIPFSIGYALNGNWGLQWNNFLTTLEQGTGQNFEPQSSYALVAVSYDRATAKAYVNGNLITTNALVGANLSFRDLWIGMLQNTFFSNYQFATIVLYNRALSGAEVRTASSYLANLVSPSISLPFTRRLIGEGDSITHGANATNNAGYFYLAHSSFITISPGPNFSVPGSTMVGVASRSAAVDAQIVAALAAGQQPVVYLMIGYNDFTGGQTVSGLEAQVIAYADARRALGAKFVLGTVLPSQSAAAISVGLNTLRAQYNSDVLAWVGSVGTPGAHVDAIVPLGTDPTMGPDAAPNNAALYSADKIHPTTVGHADLAPVLSTTMNALAYPFLLRRDLGGPVNDNRPMFLEIAA